MEQSTYVEGFHDPEAVKKMAYRQLGNTDMKVSLMSLGGGPLGGIYGHNTEKECIETVHLALKSGINYIDTSPFYGNGRSEEIIGKALKGVPRSSYYIATKVGRYELAIERMFDFSGERVEKSVDKSLKLLGLDYVDVIQVHDLEFADNIDIVLKETLPALQKVVKQGKARYIGITGYPVYLLKEVVEKSNVKIDVVLSYARNTLLDDTLKEYIPFFQSRGIGVINAAAVAMGILCHGNVISWHPAPQDIREACRKAAQHCKESGVDLGRLAVRHSLLMEGVVTHLLGCINVDVLRKNLDSVINPLTPKEEQVNKEVKERFFQPLTHKHWEGVEPVKFRQQLQELRGQQPKEQR